MVSLANNFKFQIYILNIVQSPGVCVCVLGVGVLGVGWGGCVWCVVWGGIPCDRDTLDIWPFPESIVHNKIKRYRHVIWRQ